MSLHKALVSRALAGLLAALAPAFTVPDAAGAVTFTDIAAGLTGYEFGSAAWGDFDQDGDLDLLMMGSTGSGQFTRLYRNTGGVFAEYATSLPALRAGAVAWGDHDNDGDLDILMTGTTGSGVLTRIYRNTAGSFIDAGAGLMQLNLGSAAWGDYDNDGDLDALVTGTPGSGLYTKLYRNDGAAFFEVSTSIIGVQTSSVDWGDYDNDGDLDLLIAGQSSTSAITRVYRNNAGAFTDIVAGLTGVSYGTVAWGDYDADGDLDILLTGDTGTGVFATKVYRNTGGSFFDIGGSLRAMRYSSAAWGDYDNDGDLDFVVAGDYSGSAMTLVYRNDAGVFTSDSGAALPGAYRGSVAWGDYNNDGDLDLLLAGYTGATTIARIYRSDGAPANTPPLPPGGLSAQVVGNQVTLKWSATSDAQTPPAGLSYNLRIGTSPGGVQRMSPMAHEMSGWRRVVQLGNAQKRLLWTITLPAAGPFYFWSVQAVDGAHAGSAFAFEGSFLYIAFSDTVATFAGVDSSAAAWGDYDGDGDLDLALSGRRADLTRITQIYRSQSGTYTDVAAGLPGTCNGSLAWGDCDGDGDLDLLVTGDTGTDLIARVYRNTSGVFTEAASLAGTSHGSAAWGDYDNDGDLDVLLTGADTGGAASRLYRNDGSTFTLVSTGLAAVSLGAAAWGDYDDDGDLDVALAGRDGLGIAVAKVYRNDGGTFTDIGAGLTGVMDAALAWGDHDADGDLDLLLSGNTGSTRLSRLYRNQGGTFVVEPSASLVGVDRASVGWGDYDNDGDLDILLAGATAASGPYVTRVYRNKSADFTDIVAGLPGVAEGEVLWGDCDDDGDLDVVLTGNSTESGRIARIQRGAGAPLNTRPSAPTGLAATLVDHRLTLSWNASTDGQTPAAGLSYNIRIGTTPGGSERMPGLSNPATGYRRVVQLGNAQQRTTWTLDSPFDWPSVYWSVQAVDGIFAGSTFASERFVQGIDEAPYIDSVTDVPDDQGHQVRLAWTRSSHDDPGMPPAVTDYSIFRRIDDEDAAAAAGAIAGPHGNAPSSPLLYPPGSWDFVATVPADAEDHYATVVPTLADSSIAGGMHWSVFFVRARTSTPGTHFDADPDSGWSVDNLSPAVPGDLLASREGEVILLTWDECPDGDFDYFAIYRGTEEGFDPETPVGWSTTPAWADSALPAPGDYWYRVTATDFSGNESGPSAPAHVSTTHVPAPGAVPASFFLGAAAPNPFNPVTRITYGIPAGAPATHVVISVYDASGRMVATLVDDDRSPGTHAVTWEGRNDAGVPVSPGVYFCRMGAGSFHATRRLTPAR